MPALRDSVILGLDHEVMRIEIFALYNKRLDAVVQIVDRLAQVGDDPLKYQRPSVLRSQHPFDVLHHKNSRPEFLNDPQILLVEEVALVLGEISNALHAGSPCQ